MCNVPPLILKGVRLEKNIFPTFAEDEKKKLGRCHPPQNRGGTLRGQPQIVPAGGPAASTAQEGRGEISATGRGCVILREGAARVAYPELLMRSGPLNEPKRRNPTILLH